MTEPTSGATPQERVAQGKRLRDRAARSAHARWGPAPGRPDPVELVTAQNTGRLEWLVPLRHWRMSQSAFAFYRGSASVMAFDLASTPRTGIDAQICGDAHLSNFGVYASPERSLVFDVNDFDETLAGPWEWDVKRLATSFVIAARHNDLDVAEQQRICAIAVRAYREAMAQFASMGFLDVWYAHLRVADVFDAFSDQISKRDRKRGEAFVAKTRRKGSLHARDKLAEEVDGQYRIASDPPLLIPVRDFPPHFDRAELRASIDEALADYRASVRDDLRTLLARYHVRDLALKVVGVGSVGTRCAIVLLEGRDHDDPLFLQVKEAGASVLEAHLGASRFQHPGTRVVVGQRIMQAASDIFLGWTAGRVSGASFYVRQLKDMKGSIDVEALSREALGRYALPCGWTLARAHARSADPAVIAGYLGASSRFDEAVTDFASEYADQNERDYEMFCAAIDDGRVVAREDLSVGHS